MADKIENPGKPKPESYMPLIELACREDIGAGDITSQVTISAGRKGRARLVFREPGVLCGMPVAEAVLQFYDERLGLTEACTDGCRVGAGAAVGVIEGPLRTLLATERVLLNFLGRLSGIAGTTARYADAVAGTQARIYDTRKTTPGWRDLEKYAVRCGGGCNHRQGLYDAVLIKDNHLAALDDGDLAEKLKGVLEALGQHKPRPEFVQVEVDNLEQLGVVLAIEGVDMVLLDNMTPEQMRSAVTMRNETPAAGSILLEASGGVNLETVRDIAETGVDRISVGALTHSVSNVDVGLDLV